MKLNVALAFAAVGLACASPLRVVVVSSAMGDPIEASAPHPGNFRFGHTVATINGETFAQDGAVRMRRPCAGRMSRFKEKALEISNAFRHAFGLPPIESNPHKFHILPFIGSPPTLIEVKGPNGDRTWSGRTKGGDRIQILTEPGNIPGPHRHHKPHHHSLVHGNKGFLYRLHYSLINLGTWEGRAVAFVLGCGIGVLLRMVWVFAVVAIRAFRGQDETHQYTVIAVEEVDEFPPSPPPTYVYTADEKTLEGTVKTHPAPTPNKDSITPASDN